MMAHTAPSRLWGMHPGRGATESGRRFGARRIVLLACIGTLTACATKPPHYPSQTAETYVGKPLFNLEMRWSTPSGSDQVSGGRVARWDFDQYNYAGCSVSVHTDSADIIRSVSWTQGCGPVHKKKTR